MEPIELRKNMLIELRKNILTKYRVYKAYRAKKEYTY